MEAAKTTGESIAPTVEQEKAVAGFESDQPPDAYTEWVAVDGDLFAAAEDMELGQLLQASGFGLLEAMSAIEIMDPKMDSGIDAEGVYTFEEAQKANLLPAELTIPQVIAIMDKALCCELSWYTGYNLAQTVLTCLYAHKPQAVPNRWLKTYACSVTKTCDEVRTMVMNADVYEEGDFLTSTFGFALGSDLDRSKLLTELKEVEEDLQNKVKLRKGQTKGLPKNTSPLQADASKEIQYCEALLARFRLRKSFLVMLQLMDQNAGEGLPGAKRAIEAALSHLPLILKSQSLGGDIPEHIFDPRAGRRMPVSVPPRVIDILSVSDGVAYLQTILNNHLRLCDAIEEVNASSGKGLVGRDELSALQDFVISVSARDPDILTRSRMRLLCFHSRKFLGQRDMHDVIRESMKAFPLPTGVVEHALGVSTLDKIGRVLAQQFRILSYNRARQRRKLLRSLDDWSVLVHDADMVDALIDQKQRERMKRGMPEGVTYWWSSWVVSQTFPVLRQYLLSGFDLGLYQPAEYPMIYWYLDYLLGMHIRTQVQMRDATKQQTGTTMSSGARRPVAERRAAAGRGKAGARKQPAGKVANEAEPTGPGSTLATLDFSARQLTTYAHHQLAQGLYRFLVGLGVHQGRSLTDKTDGSEYGSLENRFFSRFGGFQRLVNPPALHPDHYINLTNELIEKHRTAEGIYTSASDAFKEAKAALGMAVSHAYPPPPVLVEELKNLAQVVEANLATVTALLKDMESPNAPKSIATKVVNYDFAINKHYPVVSVKDKGAATKEGEKKKANRRKKKKGGANKADDAVAADGSADKSPSA